MKQKAFCTLALVVALSFGGCVKNPLLEDDSSAGQSETKSFTDNSETSSIPGSVQEQDRQPFDGVVFNAWRTAWETENLNLHYCLGQARYRGQGLIVSSSTDVTDNIPDVSFGTSRQSIIEMRIESFELYPDIGGGKTPVYNPCLFVPYLVPPTYFFPHLLYRRYTILQSVVVQYA